MIFFCSDAGWIAVSNRILRLSHCSCSQVLCGDAKCSCRDPGDSPAILHRSRISAHAWLHQPLPQYCCWRLGYLRWWHLGFQCCVIYSYFLLLCFNVLGTNRGPTDRIQYINKHSLICQVDTIDFLREKHSLRKPPHAFGSELVKKSETVKAC